MEAVPSAAAKPRRVLRKYTDEQRRTMVAESLVVGATVRTVAQRHGVRPTLFLYWRRRQGVLGGGFAAVAVTAQEPASALTTGIIEIDLASGCLRVRGIVDGAMLREVLAAVR